MGDERRELDAGHHGTAAQGGERGQDDEAEERVGGRGEFRVDPERRQFNVGGRSAAANGIGMEDLPLQLYRR